MSVQSAARTTLPCQSKPVTRDCMPDFLEFHLSYKDLEIDPASVFEKYDGPLDTTYAVHAPDLFSGDFIIDLASPGRTGPPGAATYAAVVLTLVAVLIAGRGQSRSRRVTRASATATKITR